MSDDAFALLILVGILGAIALAFIVGRVNGKEAALFCDHKYQMAATTQDSLAVAADGCGWFIQEPAK